MHTNPVETSLFRRDCPDCKRRSYFVAWFVEWYGWTHTCLNCGRQWEDGFKVALDFCRNARQKSIDRAKKHYRRLK